MSDQVRNVSKLPHDKGIELLLSVPAGLEDVAVSRLSPELRQVATRISYRPTSGYLTVVLHDTDSREKEQAITLAISNLVRRPPLCIFAAYISMGRIEVPQDIFEDPKDLLDYINNGFRRQQHSDTDHQEGSTIQTVDGSDCAPDMGLYWQEALSVLQCTPSSLAERLSSIDSTPIRFRASFDRGGFQHKGVRSQDLAAGLGGVVGRLFPSWKVDLTNFDIEVMGRWTLETSNNITTIRNPNPNVGQQDDPDSCSSMDEQRATQLGVEMQVGMTLPLALSTCPFRFRPNDGRTSLRMEIAFTLLALASPQPGNIVMDLCSGVGTIPIVGAIHYPTSVFVGLEILPHNADSAAENARGMIKRVLQEEEPNSMAFMQPDLLVGDARAVCWRSNSVDLIVSDLPWGQRESSHLYNCKLYPRLIREVIRLLRVGGRAVLVTGERKLLLRQLDAPFAKPYLRVLQKREITIGFKVMVFEVARV